MNVLDLYREGFVPGPKESSSDFLTRVQTVKTFVKHPVTLAKYLKIPLESIEMVSPGFLCFRGSKKLSFWFAAMTWICEFEGFTLPILQLPKKNSFFVTEREVIEHEKVHALRSAFSEPIFEEILAYSTSKKKWRRLLGPLFRSPLESYILLALLFPPLFSPFLLSLPFAFLSFLLLRLSKNQYTFQKAKIALDTLCKNSMEILTLLTDQEIEELAKGKEFGAMKKETPRWSLILLTILPIRDI